MYSLKDGQYYFEKSFKNGNIFSLKISNSLFFPFSGITLDTTLNIYFFHILDPLRCTEAWTMCSEHESNDSTDSRILKVWYHLHDKQCGIQFELWVDVSDIYDLLLIISFKMRIYFMAYQKGAVCKSLSFRKILAPSF